MCRLRWVGSPSSRSTVGRRAPTSAQVSHTRREAPAEARCHPIASCEHSRNRGTLCGRCGQETTPTQQTVRPRAQHLREQQAEPECAGTSSELLLSSGRTPPTSSTSHATSTESTVTRGGHRSRGARAGGDVRLLPSPARRTRGSAQRVLQYARVALAWVTVPD